MLYAHDPSRQRNRVPKQKILYLWLRVLYFKLNSWSLKATSLEKDTLSSSTSLPGCLLSSVFFPLRAKRE